jgi:hypothetical protein
LDHERANQQIGQRFNAINRKSGQPFDKCNSPKILWHPPLRPLALNISQASHGNIANNRLTEKLKQHFLKN